MAMNNSLAEVRPELVPEWSEKNLPLKPDEITFGSNKKVWWRGACGHEWQTSVKARSNGEKCPICSGARVIAGINDLATLEPLLVKQWSKKNKIKPTEVSIGSHKKVIWRCEKGHEWEAAVKSRTINKTGCPYCSHNKVLAGFNDLATLDVQSRMDRYTANNALLMYKQFPQASQIKEFDDWAAEGVKVNKGSKTFIILDPYEYTKKDGTIGIDFNLKRVLDVSQTNGKRPAAPTANRDPRKLVAVMLDSAPINIESTSELPYPDMGAFYKNEDQTLYVKRDIGDSVALCQCVAQELGHAELSMNSEVYSRRDMGFQAVCIGYMLCKKYGVDTQNFAIDRIPDELKNKEPKDIKAELGKTQKAFKEITARVSDELYRQRAERSKEQER